LNHTKNIIYPDALLVRKVNKQGEIKYQGNTFAVSGTLSGYLVALEEYDNNFINVYFCDQILGNIDCEIKQFIPNRRALTKRNIL